MNSTTSFVDVAGTAVFHWLAQPERSTERDLVEHLLLSDPTQPVSFEKIAARMELPIADAGRMLFALNREQALHITTAPPSEPEAYGLQAGLNTALALLVGSANHALVISDGAGLLIAQMNCAPDIAIDSTAGFAHHGLTPLATLVFRLDRITIYGSSILNPRHAGWAMLARHLLRICGGLSEKNDVQ